MLNKFAIAQIMKLNSLVTAATYNPWLGRVEMHIVDDI
jgi:hypothetical protein